MMRAHDGRIDHLQCRVGHAAAGERLQDHIPDAAVGPAPGLPKDRIPGVALAGEDRLTRHPVSRMVSKA